MFLSCVLREKLKKTNRNEITVGRSVIFNLNHENETLHFISNGEDPILRKEGTNLSKKEKGMDF